MPGEAQILDGQPGVDQQHPALVFQPSALTVRSPMPQRLPQQVPALGSLRLWQKAELTGDPTHNEFGDSWIPVP
jgi:hypothetical protein